MIRRFCLIIASAGLSAAAGCSTGSTATTPSVQPVNIAQTAKLQFAVGTATIGYSGGTFIGTNFVATFRAGDGHSATLANTPTISGPPNFVIGYPGSLNSIGGTLPNVFNQAVLTAAATTKGALLPSSFGSSLGPLIGVFGYGMAADNLLSSQVALAYRKLLGLGETCQDLNTTGNYKQISPGITSQGTINGVQVGGTAPATSEANSQELGLPLGFGQVPNLTRPCPVSPLGTTPVEPSGSSAEFPINYYGGPPAWPSAQGYGDPAFFVGYPLGFTDVATTPVIGTYSLDVAYPTDTSLMVYSHFDVSASLRAIHPLPPITISSALENSDGTGSVVVNVPPGISEAVIIARSQDCQNTSVFDNYSIVTHAVGTQKLLFGANLGPPNSAGVPARTFCVGGVSATAFAVGFDYTAYESSYPFDVSQTPQISNGDGHTGQADVTTSAPFSFTTGP